jgi:hypothetical protein
MGWFILGAILLVISAFHSSWNGQKIAKAMNSSDPKVAADAKWVRNFIIGVGIILIAIAFWPILLVLGVLFIIYILFVHK